MLHERRAQELLADFRGPWTQDLDGCVAWCSFRRGFIEEVALSDKQLIRHAAELFQNLPCSTSIWKATANASTACPKSPASTTPSFSTSPRKASATPASNASPSADPVASPGLNLGSTYLGNRGLEALADSPHLERLRELYLNDNPISDDGIRQFVLSPLVEQLEMLDVRYTQIGREGIDVLRRILGDRVLMRNAWC